MKFGTILRATIFVVLIGGCAYCTYLVWIWRHDPPGTDQVAGLSAERTVADFGADSEARINAFCGDCHTVPDPESFPQYAWPKEIVKGFLAYTKSGRQDLVAPTVEETLAYYRARAPEQLTFPELKEAGHELKATFDVQQLNIPLTGGVESSVAFLAWERLEADAPPALLISDMHRGSVSSLSLADPESGPTLLARLSNPCHVEPCDLNKDGALDLVVADLGSRDARDHDRGSVVWLRRQKGQDRYEAISIAAGLGRVADVQPGDFDGDDDLDLLVAVFGLNRTGDIRMLWNVASAGETPVFETEIIDLRPGAIHVPPCDLNSDGHLDFVALVSQEYEQIAVFMNQLGSRQRQAPFHIQSLWEGPDLTFGSSGIQLTDLDEDGDIDILYTNGDAFDNGFVFPSHGIQWLENCGELQFEYHRLADMIGAYVALPGDIDLDGDTDIVAVSWAPQGAEPSNVYDHPLASILCLEQTEPLKFVPHVLEKDLLFHAAAELADFDADGDLDLAVGYDAQHSGWVDIWWNETK